jgi:large subunit ribosomal protein L6
MSRIGRLPVPIPDQVKVAIQGQQVTVEGPKGHLDFSLPARTSAVVSDGKIVVSRLGDEAADKALHGLSRAVLNNLVRGVTQGFSKKLEIQGVGYKASVQGRQLTLDLGFSHPVVFTMPDQIKVTVEENTKITVEGPSKHMVGQVAANIRAVHPPEPYKGKGIRYVGERVVRKEGKTVQ